MKELQGTVNGLAMSLVYLGLTILVFMGMTALVVRLMQRVLPIHKEVANFLLSVSALLAMYVWFQLTF